MWLWLSLCFASTVLAQNDILGSGTTEISKQYDRTNEEVLLKIWSIFADLLDADGKTVKVPSRDNIQFALTLIKKTILENVDSPNVDFKEKLFLREAELAKSKGVYVHDNRALQTLLDLELIPNQKSNLMFKYELRANDKPNCKKAFEEIIKKVHRYYDDLANSPVCSEGPVSPQSTQYSFYIPGDDNQYPHFNTNIKPTRNIENIAATWNGNDNVGDLIQNPEPLSVPGEVNNIIGPAQIPGLNTNEQTNLLHAVKLSKDTHHLIGNDYTADLEHAKNVANKINAMYQSSNTLTPIDSVLYHKQPLRVPDTNVGAVNIVTQNNPRGAAQYARPVMQSGYVTQSQINPVNTGWNESYIINTNTIESQPPVKDIIVNQEYMNPLDTFENSKYHPEHDHDNESTTIEVPGNAENIPQPNGAPANKKISFNFYSEPNQDKEPVTEISQPENVSQLSYKSPVRTNAESPDVRLNYLNYNIYPYPNYQNLLHNSYAYKPSYKPYSVKVNYYKNPYQYYSQISALRPSSTNEYKNYMFQQSVVRPQGKVFTMNYLNQNPNTIFGQKIVQNIPPVQTDNQNPNTIFGQKFVQNIPPVQTYNQNPNTIFGQKIIQNIPPVQTYNQNPNTIFGQKIIQNIPPVQTYNQNPNTIFGQKIIQNIPPVQTYNQNPNTIFGQKIIQNIPPFETYKVNVQSKPMQNYAYGMTQIQTNVPQFTHTNYYNDQPVIDKLADWVTGTNSVKLNSDNEEAEVELTYLVKKPPPLYNPTMYYIKFRMPYKSFAKHISEILKPQNVRSASPDTDLYTNLASQYNATVVSSDMSAIPEDMKSREGNLLVRARYIEPYEPGKDNPNSVDIINLVKEPEVKAAGIGNPVNTVDSNTPISIPQN